MSCVKTQTLQKLCVKCIAANFEELYSTTINNKSLSVGAKVLQKQHSACIIKYLAENKNLKDEHLNFLLNKHTKEIDLQLLLCCSFPKLLERLEDIGNVVSCFTVHKCSLKIDSLVAHLTSLELLDVEHTNFTDTSLSILSANCRNMKTLNMYGCKNITDKGLIELCMQEPPLEELDVNRTSVTYKGVAAVLRNIHSLTKLHFDHVPKAIFEVISFNKPVYDREAVKVFNLKNLVILNNPSRPEGHLTNILTVCIETCPFVEDLAVHELITEGQVRLSSKFKNTKVAKIQSTRMTPKLNVDSFFRLRGQNLTYLSLTSFSMSLQLLADNCPNLEKLALYHPTFSNAHVVVSFPHLKVFSLHNCSFYEAEETTISVSTFVDSSPNLTEINLARCHLFSALPVIASGFPDSLKILNFDNTAVYASVIENIIKDHPGLSRINLNNSGISADEYDDLLDIVDDVESKVQITWSDYAEAIRELFHRNSSFGEQKSYCIKI